MTESNVVVPDTKRRVGKTFWQSVLDSKKAIIAGFGTAAGVFVGVVVAANGKFPTWKELVIAGASWIAVHYVTWQASGPRV
jgi:hypothetical protein